jgi:hypothetical protein
VPVNWSFTFYGLWRSTEGYYLAPVVTLYENMIEMRLRGSR